MRSVLTEDQEAFREEVATFVEEAIAPRARAIDREERYPSEILEELGARRLAGLTLPARHGGRDAGLVELTILIEELSTALMPVASALALHLGVAAEVETLGSDALREELLPAMARFETVGALGLTEASAGSDTLAMETTARRDGDGWVLTGSKQWVTNFQDADLVLTYAKTGPETDAPYNISAFLIPTERFHAETVWETLGARCVKSVAVSLEEVRVPADRMVGEEGRAYVRRGESGIGVNLPARGVGLARAALEETVAFVTQEGPVDPSVDTQLADDQGLRHRLAAMGQQVETARLLTRHAADALDRDVARGHEVSMAKVVAAEAAVDVTSEALRIHGMAGYADTHGIGRYVRDARLLPIAGGPNAGHRNALADAVLESPGLSARIERRGNR